MEVNNLAPYPVPQAITYFDDIGSPQDKQDEKMNEFIQVRVMFNQVNDLDNRWINLHRQRTALESEKLLTTSIALECDMAIGEPEVSRICFCDASKQKKYDLALEAIDFRMSGIIDTMSSTMELAISKMLKFFEGVSAGGVAAANVSPEKLEAQRHLADEISHETLSGDVVSIINHEMQAAVTGKSNSKPAPDVEHAPAKDAVAMERDSGDFTRNPHIADHAGYVRPLTALQMDCISTGEYTKLMQELLKVVDEANPVQILQSARQAYKEMMQATTRDATEEAHTHEHVSGLKQHYMILMAAPRRVHASLMAELNKVGAKQSHLDAGNVEFPKDINSALKQFTAAITSHDVNSYVKNRAEMIPVLERMRTEAKGTQDTTKQAQQHAQQGKSYGMNRGAGDHAREVLKEMHGLLAVMLKVDITFQRYWKSLDTVANYLHFVVSTARFKLSLKLQDKGMDKHAIFNDTNIRQMDRIMGALRGFRDKAMK